MLKEMFDKLNIKYKLKPLVLIYDFDDKLIGYMNVKKEFVELNSKDIKKILDYLKENG